MYLNSKLAKDTKRLNDQLETERKVFHQELLVNRKVRKMLEEQVEKMNEEYLKMKQIIKIPRLHFKQIEKRDFDHIINTYEQYVQKVDSVYGEFKDKR